MKQHTALSRLKNAYHTGKAGIIGTLTATALALTLWKGLSAFQNWKQNGVFERMATSYFIASDRSLERIESESINIERYIADVREIRDELNSLRTRERDVLDERIRQFEQRGNDENADRLREIRTNLARIDNEIRTIYNNAEQQLEEISQIPERLERYSTLWRRAVKVYSFTIYEYLDYANQRAREVRESGGLRAGIQNFLEDQFEDRIENTLNQRAEDSERIYRELRERIRMYSQAELGRQGIANLMEYLNQRLETQNIGEGERRIYSLIRDSVRETQDTEQAQEILNFLQNGATPISTNNETRAYLNSQREILNTINNVYNLVMERTELVIQAEELGIELEHNNLERLDELTARAETIVQEFSQSNDRLKQIGVNPIDPEYIGTIRTLENYYLAGLGIACLAELAVGYLFAAGSIRERRHYQLQKQYDQITNKLKQMEEKENVKQNQADAGA